MSYKNSGHQTSSPGISRTKFSKLMSMIWHKFWFFKADLTWKLPSSDCFDINQFILCSICLVSMFIPILSSSLWSLASRSVVMANDVSHMLGILITRILLDKSVKGRIPKLGSIKDQFIVIEFLESTKYFLFKKKTWVEI